MSYQQGSIRRVPRKNGDDVWHLRFRESTADGGRRECVIPIGSVRDFPKERDARKEVDRRGLLVRVNAENQQGRIHFDALAEFYLKVEHGPEAVRQKSDTTIPIVRHYVRDYLIPRWRDELAEEIPSIAIQRWLVSLHKDKRLAWTTVSKVRGLMNRIFRIGLRYGLVEKQNPVEHTESRCKSDYKAIIITPSQTFTILEKLSGNPLHCALVITIAATGLRSSETLSLRWADILWDEGKIRVSKRWAKGKDGATKTAASNSTVPLHPILSEHLKQWHTQTPYAKPGDFVFPSLTRGGKVPIWPSTFIADYLRPAAKAAGVQISNSQRLGLHNFRHSLATFLATTKTHPKVVQGLLRHADIKVTLGLYTQEDSDEKQAAQGAFLAAMGLASPLVQ